MDVSYFSPEAQAIADELNKWAIVGDQAVDGYDDVMTIAKRMVTSTGLRLDQVIPLALADYLRTNAWVS